MTVVTFWKIYRIVRFDLKFSEATQLTFTCSKSTIETQEKRKR